MWSIILHIVLALAIPTGTDAANERLSLAERETLSYSIGSDSELSITGTSNVTKFCCSSSQSFPQGDLSYEWSSDSRITISNARLVIDANNLDCGHKGITRDFKKTLLVEDHPNIVFLLHEVALRRDIVAAESDWNWAVADTEIIIAGCSNHKFLDVQFKMQPDNSIALRAFTRLCVSDFGLESPKPLLGLIKVEDEVDVEIFMTVTLEGQG